MLERQIFINTLEGEWSLVSLDCGHWACIAPDPDVEVIHVQHFKIDVLDCSIEMLNDGEVVVRLADVSAADVVSVLPIN